MSITIVTTTINKPVLLDDYCRNAKKFNHQKVNFIVIGDKKTPATVGHFCAELERKYGYTVEYLGIADQISFLDDFKELREHLPYNSIQRRNIGILKAYLDGAETIITIDDDNFVKAEDDFIGQHSIVGHQQKITAVSSSSGWFNVCKLLKEERGLPFYHRGFPIQKRSLTDTATSHDQKRIGKVVVNAGLWLDAPDIDAITWLAMPVKAVGITDEYPRGMALEIGTWSPFNSQNTALAREVVPAYFLSPHLGRYDDIWASYIVKRIADHLGDYIHYGYPLVTQERNYHDYLNDLKKEQFGMELSDNFVDGLRMMNFSGRNYQECFVEVIDWLSDWMDQNELLKKNEPYREQVSQMITGMKIWKNIFIKDKKIINQNFKKSTIVVPEKKDNQIKLNLGCGDRPIAGFLNAYVRNISGIEYPNTSINNLSHFQDDFVDYIYACHVLEHIPREQTFAALLEWNRVLKVGGMLRVAVPDWDSIVRYYNKTEDLTNLLNFTFGGREDPTNSHYRVFNFATLKTLLWEAGFKRITRYDWRDTEHADHDDFSKAYLPHMDEENGLLMSLNIQCIKHTNINISDAGKTTS